MGSEMPMVGTRPESPESQGHSECGGLADSTPEGQGHSEHGNPNEHVQGLRRCKDTSTTSRSLCPSTAKWPMSLLARGLFSLSSNNMLLTGQWAGEKVERSDGAESAKKE